MKWPVAIGGDTHQASPDKRNEGISSGDGEGLQNWRVRGRVVAGDSGES